MAVGNKKNNNHSAVNTFSDDEVLVKGGDGKFYILRGAELAPYEAARGERPVLDYKRIAEEIIDKSGSVALTPVRRDQLFNVIVSGLKGVRDSLEIKNILVKPIGVGGLELNEDKTKLILDLIKLALEDKLGAGTSRGEKQEGKIASVVSVTPASDIKSLEKLVNEVVGIIKKDYPKELEMRLRGIILTYLKDIRDKRETRETLERQIAKGGMSFEKGRAEKLVNFIDDLEKRRQAGEMGLKKEFPSPKKEFLAVPVKEALVGESSNKADVSQFVAKEREAFKESVILKDKYLAPPPLAIVKKEEGAELPSRALEKELSKPGLQKFVPPLRPKITPQPPPASAPLKQTLVVERKPQIQDIKYKPRLVGPIEELRTLTLRDFRKLSEDPKIATEKIQNKINLLEEESFAKRMEGARAWQKSPLNQEYLKVGQKSLLEGKSVEQIIAENLSKSKESLNKAEFNAIMGLNKRIRL
ncbi:MAG: hypothetical protein PHD51_02550 [Patescibacteria group bacterium]|nr:hypothetical protein [Patescibacteria group bacterium]MDD5490262.1 hypothetical protein [Patescibacteria group bacterium]